MANLKLCSLNVRGLGASDKRASVFLWFNEKDCDVIFLQETHSSIATMSRWINEWGSRSVFSHGTTMSKGVAILFKSGCPIIINNSVIDENGRFIICDVSFNDRKLVLCNIYAPNDDEPEFFNHIFQIIDNDYSDRELIIGGDFNFVQNIRLDKFGGRHTTHMNSQKTVSQSMENLDLVDIWRVVHQTDRCYTWRQRNPQVHCRLDYYLISFSLLGAVSSANISPGFRTDHSMISLNIQLGTNTRGPGFWKLNCSLLKDVNYINTIKKIIQQTKDTYMNDNEVDDILLWEMIKCNIRGETVQYASRKKKHDKKELFLLERDIAALEGIQSLNPTQQNDEILSEKKIKYEQIMDYRTQGNIIRSRAQYYEHGEKSSKYFLSLEKRNHNNKVISKLVRDDGADVTDQKEILEMEKNFYKTLYKSRNNYDTCPVEIVSDYFPSISNINKLTNIEKESCDGLLTEKEIWNAVISTENNRTPGTDGIPVDFYKIFWADISRALLNALNLSFRRGQLSISQRRGIISLIPKKEKNPWFLKNWRPISLLNAD